jgi:hypothetical protein
MKEDATLYMFQCEEKLPRGGEKDGVIAAWHGCNMSKVGEWVLTAPNELADMLDCLRTVANWVRRSYVPVVHGDLTQWSDILGK